MTLGSFSWHDCSTEYAWNFDCSPWSTKRKEWVTHFQFQIKLANQAQPYIPQTNRVVIPFFKILWFAKLWRNEEKRCNHKSCYYNKVEKTRQPQSEVLFPILKFWKEFGSSYDLYVAVDMSFICPFES